MWKFGRSLTYGKQVHNQIIKSRLKPNVILQNALITMYAKCGSLEDARLVFDEMSQRDLISWTAMIAAYAQHGQGREVLNLFDQMQQREDIEPNHVTFVSVLSGCSHSGLVDEGVRLFDVMQTKYNIGPTKEHYSCFVDLFARAGQLDKVEEVIMNAPVEGDVVMWTTLLGGCRTYGDVERAERAAAHILELDPQNAPVYVLLGNIYAAARRWDDEARIRKLMQDRGVQKEPGQSWIEINGKVHTFMMDDRAHPEHRAITAKMAEVSSEIRAMGYVLDTTWALHNVDEEQKAKMLCRHSEKLAIAYGLMSTPPGTPLIVVKNLRVCGDCHAATKLIAKAYAREIRVRDANRYHHFSTDGTCSCCDYF